MFLIAQQAEQVFGNISVSICDWTKKTQEWVEVRCDTSCCVYALWGLILFHLVSQACRFTLHASWESSTAGKTHSHLLTDITYISIKPLWRATTSFWQKKEINTPPPHTHTHTKVLFCQWGLFFDFSSCYTELMIFPTLTEAFCMLTFSLRHYFVCLLSYFPHGSHCGPLSVGDFRFYYPCGSIWFKCRQNQAHIHTYCPALLTYTFTCFYLLIWW